MKFAKIGLFSLQADGQSGFNWRLSVIAATGWGFFYNDAIVCVRGKRKSFFGLHDVAGRGGIQGVLSAADHSAQLITKTWMV